MDRETLAEIIEFVALNFVPTRTGDDVIFWQTSYHDKENKYTTHEIIDLFLEMN